MRHVGNIGDIVYFLVNVVAGSQGHTGHVGHIVFLLVNFVSVTFFLGHRVTLVTWVT